MSQIREIPILRQCSWWHVLLVPMMLTGLNSCITTDPWAPYGELDPRGNIFVQGYDSDQPPRYGHGGTESPSERRARREREQRAYEKAERERAAARRRANERKRREAERQRQRDSLADDKPELPEDVDVPEEEPEVEPEPNPTSEPKTEPNTGRKRVIQPRERETTPYGRPVPGKPGMVYSPHAPDAGYVEVENIKPGTLVKCPYTQKLFRVP